MQMHAPLINDDGEVRELTVTDMMQFRPAREVLPSSLQKTLGMRPRGPQKAPVKRPTTIRLSPQVVEAFRATGKGWQTRIDAVLCKAVAQGWVKSI